jgi:hypothetical protein
MRASRVSPWPVNKRTHANPVAVAASFSTESTQSGPLLMSVAPKHPIRTEMRPLNFP